MTQSSYLRLIVVLDTYPALSETFLYTTLKNLQGAGFKVNVLARKRGQAPHLDEFPVHYLPSENLPSPIKLLVLIRYGIHGLVLAPRSTVRFIRHLRGKYGLRKFAQEAFRNAPLLLADADLIYLSFGGLAVKYGEYVQFEQNSVFSLRGSDIHITPLVDPNYADRLKIALHHARGIHCVCEDIRQKAEILAGKPLPQSRVIYTAINPIFAESDGLVAHSHTPIRLISVSRLDWRKGLEHGIVAAKTLRERGVDFHWEIVGDGDYRIPLEWAIRDFELQEVVSLVGGLDQTSIRAKLASSDIFFHPTIHEGLSNAVLEAMAMGLPVVCSDVSGMHEAIFTGENGFLVPPRDWQAMVNVLTRLAHDVHLRQRIGTRARQHVLTHFTSERQQREFQTLFEQAMS